MCIGQVTTWDESRELKEAASEGDGWERTGVRRHEIKHTQESQDTWKPGNNQEIKHSFVQMIC